MIYHNSRQYTHLSKEMNLVVVYFQGRSDGSFEIIIAKGNGKRSAKGELPKKHTHTHSHIVEWLKLLEYIGMVYI